MQIEIIVVPYEVGRSDTAPAQAPAILLENGLKQALDERGFEYRISPIWSRVSNSYEGMIASIAHAASLLVTRARTRGRFPLIISGSCLIATGVVAGLQRPGRSTSILWLDAHGDFNTPESSPSGYLDGMALAATCGRSLADVYRQLELRPISYKRIAHWGGRAFDPPEVQDFARLGVHCFSPADLGDPAAVESTRGALASTPEVYCHIDLDAFSDMDAPAVTYPEPGGLPLAATLDLLEQLPAPTAVTLAGMSFQRDRDSDLNSMVATCDALLSKLLPA